MKKVRMLSLTLLVIAGLVMAACGPGVGGTGTGYGDEPGAAGLARARIGGQTGDILGAAQQVAETTLLLGLLAAIAG